MTVRNRTISISQNQDRKYGLSASRLQLCACLLQVLNRQTTGPSVQALLALVGYQIDRHQDKTVKLGQTKRPQTT